jgi:hypothetical protein
MTKKISAVTQKVKTLVVHEQTVNKIKEYTYSSIITFLAMFVFVLSTDVKSMSFDELWTAGYVGGGAVIIRAIAKAAWDGVVASLIALSVKLKR